MSFHRGHVWPRWTPGTGAGGVYKQTPNDFIVEELPLKKPDSTGEHQWLKVEKVNRTTPEVATILAELAGVGREAVGYAGLKDRSARTTQIFTIAGGRPIESTPEGITVLERAHAKNKLRIGQLRGNRFRIRVVEGDPEVAARRAATLVETGMPNYYGAQRFSNDAPERGFALLTGRIQPEGIEQARFALSAWQAWLFNTVLAERGRARLDGDLLEDGEPTGPMYGWSMAWPTGAALELEERILGGERLAPDALRRYPDLTRGTRRLLRVVVAPTIIPTTNGFWLSVTLPPGSYATVMLDELL